MLHQMLDHISREGTLWIGTEAATIAQRASVKRIDSPIF
jgi:hypothetical protein